MGSDDDVSEWRSVPLSELTESPVTYGVVQPGSATAGGVPMLRVNNFSGHVLDLSEVLQISPEVEAKYERTRIRGGDVLLTIVGSVGQVAAVPDRLSGWNIARAVALIRPKNPELSRWISLVLRSPAAQQRLGTTANTTVQTTINLRDLRVLPIPMPSCEVREAICVLLGALNDRIETLRSINLSLEAIAKTLFKSWFIDFDPVRAKAEGREPEGMDTTIAALFPNDFLDLGAGFVPTGWSLGTLADLSQLNASKWSTKSHPESVRYIDLGGVRNNQIDPPPEIPYGEAPSRARHHLREGDTIVGTVRPGNRAFAYIHQPEESLTGSTGFAVLSPKSPEMSGFVYLAATCDPAIERLANLADGAAYPAVRPSVVADTSCVIPSDSVMKAFSDVVKPLLERISRNSATACLLAKINDTILPHLISGKLRLPEAERKIQDAAT